MQKPRRLRLPHLVAISLTSLLSAEAATVGSMSFHGAVSATAAFSDEYNYLGDTKGSPTINGVEAIINGSRRFDNGLRLSAQLYAYELDNYSDVALDFAALDYAVSESFGLRAGRVKWAAGLYGDVQDIDILRPFAYLPLGFYQKTLRPISASFDGVSAYGTLSLGSAGSLDYQVGGGFATPVSVETPYLRSAMQNTLNNVSSFDGDTVSAAWLFWNLPVNGLRVGYSHNAAYNFAVHGPMKTAAEASAALGSARFAPLAFPPGAWDLLIAGQPARLDGDQTRQTFSAEYTRGDWQFAAEYLLTSNDTTIRYPLPIGASSSVTKNEAYYGMATWQATDRWQFGAYYGESFANKNDRSGRTLVGAPRHTGWLKDAAVAASYSATDWWLLKAEVHLLDGTYGMTTYNNPSTGDWPSSWTYYVLKSTVSF